MIKQFESERKISGIHVVIISLCIILFSPVFFGNCTGNNRKSTTVPQDTVKLGRYLFYDRRLSVNNTRSCGTCHNPRFAFTDGYKRSLGVFADLHQRNTQPLFNLSSLKYFTSADSTLHSAYDQMNNPLYNMHPEEMGVKGNEAMILKRIESDSTYKKLFSLAEMDMSWNNIKLAISSFIYTIRSDDAPYDKYKNGDSNAISESQKSGMKLFFSSALHCASCHGAVNFSTPVLTDEKADTLFYFNTGLYNIDGKGSYPVYDQGLYRLTKNKADMGKFRVPTLRNLAFTAPYFHDGSASTLMEVIDSYEQGGRKIEKGIYMGDGSANLYKHPFIAGFNLSEIDKYNLVDFLLSLSDSALINDPSVQNPFTNDETKKKY